VPQLLGLHAAAAEARPHGACAPQGETPHIPQVPQEEPPQGDAHTAQVENRLHLLQLEKAQAPSTAKTTLFI